ncbi:NUDIX domain-containing protein [Promicromonospora sp. NPDC023805]|uniref:NUDIX hydrolase n=1 Tax=Promicromonospora sp. NPDC023805 TaxID=3154696 RepID=UPI0033F53615
MTFRLAAYALCIDAGRVLLVHHRATDHWTLPGGGVEHGEDPIETPVRELHEETGYRGAVERLLGVDSRIIPAAERLRPGPEHQNVGIYYRVAITGGDLRTEPDPEIVAAAWVPIDDVANLRRSSLVAIGLGLNEHTPADGHVVPVAVGGLLEH